jgi:CRP-like cAMP-binding protein
MPDWLEPLLRNSRSRAIPATTFLQRQGEKQTVFFWLKEGTARAVYHSAGGNERIKEFYFAGECCFLYLNWLTQTAADYSLQMLTDGIIAEIPLSELDKEKNATARLALLTQQVMYKEKKEQMFLLNNPQQRWQYVQENFPDWEAQLTQKDLASYIGISPVSLSRIRRRLNKG